MQEARYAEGTSALTVAEWQKVLFKEQPKRSELLGLVLTENCPSINLRVHRNHSFEHVATASQPYFNFDGYLANFQYSDYDDSFSFKRTNDFASDVEILWIDYNRYTQLSEEKLVEWLLKRISQLREISLAPILLFNRPGDSDSVREFNRLLKHKAQDIIGVRVAETEEIYNHLGEGFFDARLAQWSGTPFSDKACILIARSLACRWIPAIMRRRVKAVALDLDNTLYEGVLGEDGSDGIILTDAHRKLQQHLVELNEQGIFLSLVSRNEIEDVEELLNQRQDFPLKKKYFSAMAVSWGAKAGGIAKIADSLRVGLDSILFVDDNPGEVLAVSSAFPQLKILYAGSSPAVTLETLQWFPGLWKWEIDKTDELRVRDLKAEEKRQELQSKAVDEKEYLRSLQATITLKLDSLEDLARITELSHKTNQFNLNLQRMKDAEIADFMRMDDKAVVSIGLSDKLSDSGLIGMVAGRRKDDKLIINEICVSCRALGRGLDTVMLEEAVRLMTRKLPAGQIVFEYSTGPRNQPAKKWLGELTGVKITDQGVAPAPEQFAKKAKGGDLPVRIISQN